MNVYSLPLRRFSNLLLLFCLFPSIVHADGIKDTSVSDTSISNTNVHDTSVSDLISSGESSGAKAANEASVLIDAFRNNSLQKLTSGGKGVGSPDYKQNTLKDITLTHKGKGNCKGNSSKSSAKCPSSLLKGLEAKQSSTPSSNTHLLIFVSQSMPASSIKELWHQAQKLGGKLLFRGLVGGSFKETQKHIYDLGVVAEIDPTKFDVFKVVQVPTFVLSKSRSSSGGQYDKMAGNVSLAGFLRQVSLRGTLQKEGKAKLNILKGESH